MGVRINYVVLERRYFSVQQWYLQKLTFRELALDQYFGQKDIMAAALYKGQHLIPNVDVKRKLLIAPFRRKFFES
jgi:hypothetical protein